MNDDMLYSIFCLRNRELCLEMAIRLCCPMIFGGGNAQECKSRNILVGKMLKSLKIYTILVG